MKSLTQLSTGFIGLIPALMCSFSLTHAQGQSQNSEIEYSRPSVTTLFTIHPGDVVSRNAALSAEKIPFTDKYFNHNLENHKLEVSPAFADLSHEAKKTELKYLLERENLGRKMIEKWFNRQADGYFNLDYIHQCGLYNASDQDVLISGAAKRGEAVLLDAGEKLVNKTYVMVIAPKEFAPFDDEVTHGWNATYDLFLFKLDFDSEVVSRFYDVWPYDDDSEEVRNQKIAAFDTLNFTFTPFYGKADMTSSASEVYALTKNPKTSDQLFDETVEGMYNNTLFSIDKDLEPFRVKVNVSGTHPIRSKIGKKEGLRCEQRYFVYEFVWNDKAGTAELDRKAVVRSNGKITDNRTIATGASGESQFYQVYGGTVRQGMLMQQRNDLGLSILAGYEAGGIGGFDMGLWFRTGIVTNVPSLYLMADIGFDSGPYETVLENDDNFSFIRFAVGIGKGLRMARIVEITPYLAWGQESTSYEDVEDITTDFIKGGGVLNINVTHNLSLIGQLNFYAPYGGISITEKDEESITLDEGWTDWFDDRSGMSMMFGLRLEF
jgi:hypothetical protein